jgi:phage tail sheath protein FI
MIRLIAALFGLIWAAISSYRPNVEIDIITAPQPSSLTANSTTWFVAGLCDFGRTDKPILVTSMNDFITKCGARVSYSLLYDALDTFFREGGNQAYVGRVVGPGATKGTHNFLDGSAGVSLIVSSTGAGASSANISVAIVTGSQAGSYQLQVLYNGVVVEQSPDLLTQNDAVTWAAANSNYISVTAGASTNNPVNIAATALSAGNDDRANITDTQWLTALNLFTNDYGPGQVSAPGRTTDTGHTQLLDHAASHMRTALLDAPDSSNSATLITSATNAKATNNGQFGAMFAPWVVVPGVTSGTTRTVPPSALVAGAIARNDPANGPGSPAAGLTNGLAQFSNNVDQPAWDTPTRDSLNTGGVNVIRVIGGQVTIFGWRSLANPNINPSWVGLGTVRYLQNLSYRAWQTGQQYMFALIDGQGQTISRYGAALTSLLQGDWTLGEIYGQTPDQAFKVDVSPAVNTPANLQNNILTAVLEVRPSPFAELVKIQIVNIPITQPV